MKNKLPWYLVAVTLLVMALFSVLGADNSSTIKVFGVSFGAIGGCIIGLITGKK